MPLIYSAGVAEMGLFGWNVGQEFGKGWGHPVHVGHGTRHGP